MKKKRSDKKGLIGRIQFIVGVLLLVGGIVGIILSYNWYINNLSDNVGGFKSYVNTIQANMVSNETRYLGILGVYNYYVGEESRIKQIFITLELTFVLITIISVLFITQGLINLPKKER
jgi:hypothetical protein